LFVDTHGFEAASGSSLSALRIGASPFLIPERNKQGVVVYFPSEKKRQYVVVCFP
jgi:hypothetical protein